nr:helix-turn-helix domain-containing protein [Acinetobacter bouvetii]
MIIGETRTEKEHVVRQIHTLSHCAKAPFFPVRLIPGLAGLKWRITARYFYSNLQNNTPYLGQRSPAIEPKNGFSFNSSIHNIQDAEQLLQLNFHRLFQAAQQLPELNINELIEAHFIRSAYEYCQYNQVHTARLLGVTRNVIRTCLLKYGLL